MRTTGKRLLSSLLCLCMAMCMLPTVAFAAETDKAIQLGTSGISGYDAMDGAATVTLTLLLPDGLSAEGMEVVDEFTYKLTRTAGEDGKIAPIVLSCEDEGAFSAELAAAISETNAFKSSALTAVYDETGDTLTISGAPAESAELDMNAILTAAMAAMGAYDAEPAGDDHSHCVCGDTACADAAHGGALEWKGISDLSEIAAAGNYYLKNDVTLSSAWTCSIAGVNLCLGGKTITGKDGAEVIYVAGGASLTITDCGTSGKITHESEESGCGIKNNATLTLWNGTISGNKIHGAGGGVYLDGVGNFTMNGGTISDNIVFGTGGGVCLGGVGNFTMNGGTISGNSSVGAGGGVCLDGVGNFTMNGGSIMDNITTFGGGGVCLNGGGDFTMNGGSIMDNTVTFSDGGGVCLDGAGNFTMNGGSIMDNTAAHGDGGGVYNNSGLFTMNGGSIMDNTAGDGGGVYNYRGLFTMNGGSIMDNTTTYGDGGGVYADGYNKFKLSGTPVISGNVKGGTITNGVLQGGTTNNLYLPSGINVRVESGNPLAATASIGITAEAPENYPTVVTDTTSTTGFFSDNTDYVLMDDGSNGLMLAKVITVSGVKLLTEVGGTEMTGGKTYDGKDVAYNASAVIYTPTVLGVTLTYTWQKPNGETYSDLSAAPKDTGSYRLLVSAVKNGNTLGTQVLAFAVNKAEQDAPAKPDLDSRTKNSITLKEIPVNSNGAKAQYRMNGGDWQDSPAFTGLSSATEYSFTARYAETDNYNASPASEAATFSTNSSGGYNPPVYYTLTFETNGGDKISPVSGSYNALIDLSKYAPKRSGYAFTGWYSDKGLTEKITSVRLNGSKTVYAGWQAEQNPNTGANPFTDVNTTDWFYNDVMFVYEKGLMLGTSKTTFSPYNTATRGMMATILWRMEGSPAPKGGNGFADVDAGKWYADAITWTAENGIFRGYDNNLFMPENPITREQLSAIFYRYADYKGYDTSVKGNLSKFKDANKISDYAETAMQWAVGSGLVKGRDDGSLDPQGTATRAEIAAMLHRFIEKYDLVQGTTSGGMTGWISRNRLQVPQTGDSSTLGLWGFTLCASLAAFLALGTVRIRRREEEAALQIIEK